MMYAKRYKVWSYFVSSLFVTVQRLAMETVCDHLLHQIIVESSPKYFKFSSIFVVSYILEGTCNETSYLKVRGGEGRGVTRGLELAIGSGLAVLKAPRSLSRTA